MTRARDVANLIGSGNYSSTTFTATAGQTAFTISHTQGFVQVFMNGLLLDLTVDYTSNGSAITLTSGAAAGDEIEVVAYNTFSVGDALNQAAADTRYVNATGDNMTGNLGIGTTSPNGALHVKGISDHGKIVVEHGGTSGSTNHNFISFHNHAGNTVAEIQSEENATNSSALLFKTGGTTTNMTVSHNGHVTMPNQPSFAAYVQNNSTYDANSVGNAYINYDAELYDTGNNHSAGIFTAPVAGVYYFRAEAYTNDYCTQSWFIVNGSRTNASDTVYTGNDTFSGNSTILKLAANDTVGFHPYRSGNSSMTVNANANHSWFRGMLIG